ncbi:MAG: hypothetical protein OXB93_03120, partial [Cytophagales bacterium]|nr:hypothetical protein [Cytophagales bacterium]
MRVGGFRVGRLLVSVFVAFVFWFLNAFNRTYTASLDFPIEFSYDEETVVVVDELPKEILLNISGAGWDILKTTSSLLSPPLLITIPSPSTRYLSSRSLFNTLY